MVFVFAFLYGKFNSKEICEEIAFPSFFRKMLMSAFLMKLKANYLKKMRGNPNFSLWIPIAHGEASSTSVEVILRFQDRV